MIVKTYITDPTMKTNTHIAMCEVTGKGILIDPGKYCSEVFAHISKQEIKIQSIVNTHTHPDHCFGNAEAHRLFGAPILLNEHEIKRLRSMETARFIPAGGYPVQHISEGSLLSFGKTQLRVAETPGHTNGSISLFNAEALFPGDCLTIDTLPDGDLTVQYTNRQTELGYLSSVMPLIDAYGDVTVFPGHGPPFRLGNYWPMAAQ